jgi:thiamine monophosphate synthase
VDTVVEAVAADLLPVCAFGGITMDNLAELAATGCGLLAVSRDIDAAPDPAAAVRQMVELLETAEA